MARPGWTRVEYDEKPESHPGAAVRPGAARMLPPMVVSLWVRRFRPAESFAGDCPCPASVAPLLVPRWQTVEERPRLAPWRNKPIHKRQNGRPIRRLQRVAHLVHHDVLQACPGFLRKLGVQPQRTSDRVAAAPLGLHLLHLEPTNLDTQSRCPDRNQFRQLGPQDLAIPARHDRLPARRVGARPNAHQQSRMP